MRRKRTTHIIQSCPKCPCCTSARDNRYHYEKDEDFTSLNREIFCQLEGTIMELRGGKFPGGCPLFDGDALLKA